MTITQDEIAQKLEQAIDNHRSGRFHEAKTGYDAVLEADPNNVHALSVYAILRFQNSEPEVAISLIKRAIEIDPTIADLHNNLGNIYRELDRKEDAATAYRAALAVNPQHVESLCNSAMLIMGSGNSDEAREILEDALKVDPDHIESNHNLGLIHAIEGRLEEAADCFERCHKDGRIPVVDPSWHALTLSALGHSDRALAMLERLAEARPDDPVVAHHLAAARGEGADRASDGYVKNHFDNFADSFDATLEKLGYSAPEHVARAIKSMCADYKVPLMLDLGCGTGLVGPLIREHVQTLVGIDLSPRMLEHARKRGDYDQLIEGELVDTLNRLPAGQAQMAFAADTIIYFGALEEAMAAMARSLCPGGACILTVEKLEDEAGPGYAILPSGRYAHTEAYVTKTGAAVGLSTRHVEALELRVEAGKPVHGLLFVLENADNPG